MAKRHYPITIRDIAPGPGAIRMTGSRSDGSSDGFHTGGAWFYQGKVWKPLDGRPYANASSHIETTEEQCLVALRDKPLFPQNWVIKEANGRRFIVRDRVPVFPGGGLRLTLKDLLEIESGLIEMNRLNWEVNDDLVIGKDRRGKLFIVDLSAASYTTGSHAYAANDSSHFDKLCRLAGFEEIPTLKSIGRELAVQVVFSKTFKVDASTRRQLKYFYSSDHPADDKDLINITSLLDEIPPTNKAASKHLFWFAATHHLPENVAKVHKLTLRYQRRS